MGLDGRWWCVCALVITACGPGLVDVEHGGSGDGGSDDGALEHCGDGVVDPGESCDDGLATSACNEWCQVPGTVLRERTIEGCGGIAVRGDPSGELWVLAAGCISGTNVSEMQLTRLDGEGTPRWSRTWTDPDTSYARPSALGVDGDGNAVVVGRAGNGNIVQAMAGYAWTRKYDAAGELMWMDVHVRDDGQDTAATDVAIDGAGRVRVAGGGYTRAWVRELSADGAAIGEHEHELDDGLGHTTHLAANGGGAWVVAMNQQPDADNWITGVFVHAPDGAQTGGYVVDHAPAGRDLPVAVQLGDDGTIVIAGEFEDPDTYANTTMVAVVSPDGQPRWTWEAGEPSDTCGVAVDRGGNAFVAMIAGEYQDESVVITRLGPDGAVAWQSVLAASAGEILGLGCGIGLDAAENPVITGALVGGETWVAWLAR